MAASKWIKTYILFKTMIKGRCEIQSCFPENLLVAASKWVKTYFVQNNDQRKMWNTPSEIAKYKHKLINADIETKPLRVKLIIKMAIGKW